ncbi:MAG TPA: hypothetical protein PKE07_07020, partial [Lacibacter sp.]|nr:hypothetical protein [Lacibacter sp.]
MKKTILLLFLTCLLATGAGAQVVTGVYKGIMEVDSPRYNVNFELTLKEKNGKLFGYCYRLFILGDTLYYNLVRVTARVTKDLLVVEDEKSVSNNFAETRRGIKTVFFFRLADIADTAQVLPGEWSINQWRGYTPLTGKVSVQRERNYLATEMYQRLAEKKLDQEMRFDEPAPPVLASNQPKKQPATNQPPVTPNPQPVTSNPVPSSGTSGPQPVTSNPQPVTTTQPPVTSNPQPVTSIPKPVTTQTPVTPNPQPVTTNQPPVTSNPQPVTSNPQPA